ncbi:hypothetical protein ANCCAN_07053 [Ancylostoma caninum]|uniref:Uncharacterized protein n=1 Tax=Ancylostoma caninum TaxID=29170 RepID=A0A368GRB4_ANCCA|nr:hypothetical protein ANCCAN_07053 [Ancylostoma caninum]
MTHSCECLVLMRKNVSVTWVSDSHKCFAADRSFKLINHDEKQEKIPKKFQALFMLDVVFVRVASNKVALTTTKLPTHNEYSSFVTKFTNNNSKPSPIITADRVESDIIENAPEAFVVNKAAELTDSLNDTQNPHSSAYFSTTDSHTESVPASSSGGSHSTAPQTAISEAVVATRSDTTASFELGPLSEVFPSFTGTVQDFNESTDIATFSTLIGDITFTIENATSTSIQLTNLTEFKNETTPVDEHYISATVAKEQSNTSVTSAGSSATRNISEATWEVTGSPTLTSTSGTKKGVPPVHVDFPTNMGTTKTQTMETGTTDTTTEMATSETGTETTGATTEPNTFSAESEMTGTTKKPITSVADVRTTTETPTKLTTIEGTARMSTTTVVPSTHTIESARAATSPETTTEATSTETETTRQEPE